MGSHTCELCEQFFNRNRNDCILVKHPLEQLNRNGKKPIHDFLCDMNSLLNGTGGYAIIHADKDANVDGFDQKVDEKLLKLIPDTAVYQDVYERYLLDDKHVLYRVKTRSGRRPLSVLDFRTKFSVSKGITDPTQGQMNGFVKRIIDPSVPQDSQKFDVYRGTLGSLEKDKVVTVTRGLAHLSDPVSLRENICTQAKAFYTPRTSLDVYCLDYSKPYISAFSKIPGGGSVYIGLKECKQPGPDSGKLQPEAFLIPPGDKADIQAYFRKSIHDELCWVGRSKLPEDVVTLEYKPVTENGQTLTDAYVLEVKVNYYHGVCFLDPLGPELYVTNWRDNVVRRRIEIEEWLKTFDGYESLQVKKGKVPAGAGAVAGNS